MDLPVQSSVAGNVVLTKEVLDDLEAAMLKSPQREASVTHKFAPGLYIREVFLPAETFAVGHHQNFEHLNVMLKGRVTMVMADGSTLMLTAPQVFVGQPGRKVGYIHEDTVWQNIYPSDSRDAAALEAKYVTKSETALAAIEASKEQNEVRQLTAGLPELPPVVSEEPLAELPVGSYKFTSSRSPSGGIGIYAVGPISPGEMIGPYCIDGRDTILGRHVRRVDVKLANTSAVSRNGNGYLYATRPIKGATGGLLGEEILTF